MTLRVQTSRDRWIPWMLVALLVALTIPPVLMVVVAIKTFPGKTTENSYQKGLAYNQAIAAGAAQKALGWQLKLGAHAGTDRTALLTLDARDRHSQPLTQGKVTAFVVRLTQQGYDQKVDLPEITAGVYQKQVVLPLSGMWDVRLSIVHGDDVAQATQRFQVP